MGLGNRELDVHAERLVAGHGAVEVVRPRLEVDLELCLLARLDLRRALLRDPRPLDRQVVRDRAVVLEVERVPAALHRRGGQPDLVLDLAHLRHVRSGPDRRGRLLRRRLRLAREEVDREHHPDEEGPRRREERAEPRAARELRPAGRNQERRGDRKRDENGAGDGEPRLVTRRQGCDERDHGGTLARVTRTRDRPVFSGRPSVDMNTVEAARLPWIPLGELLVRRGLLEHHQLEEALEERATSGMRIGEVIVDRGWVTPAAIAHALSEQYGLDFISLDEEELDPEVTGILPETLARRYEAVPVRFLSENLLLVAVADPTNVLSSDGLRLAIGHNLQLVVATEPDVSRALNKIFRNEFDLTAVQDAPVEQVEETAEITDTGAGAPIINLVNAVLKRAIEDGASDVHFEPQVKQMLVRARVDGVTRELLSIPKHMQPGVTSRLKVMGGLDIAERRLPQDGRVSVRVAGSPMDIRIAVVPTTYGEQIVLRIFHRGIQRYDLSQLGMSPTARAQFERAIRQPHGGVIVCGPTGSGKTTTLYAAVDALNSQERVVQTIEDPVEFQIEGINQVEVNTRAGLTFSRGLRALLRADPDVILVGEIRDEETAKIASQAALTGHLVLSSLHAHSAASSIERLKNMGVEPSLLATSLNCIIGQRLARRLCLSCRQRYQAPAEELAELGLPPKSEVELYRPKGCAECGQTGHAGRVALYEVMAVDGNVRRLLDASTEEIFAAAVEQGMTTMRDEGVRLCLEGVSSLEEICRVTGDRVG